MTAIEHDAVIGRSCHISVGAKLAGEVSVGQGTHIGIGAVVIQGIEIGENCIIGAGAVVTRDVPDNHVAVGVPAVAKPRSDAAANSADEPTGGAQ